MPRRVVCALLVLGSLLLVAAPAEAAILAPITYRVTTTADQANGPTGGLSLREAAALAADDDTDSRIVLGIGATYELDRCGAAPDQGALLVDNVDPAGFYLTVQGRGSTIEQTCAGESVWHQVAYSPLLLRDLTITGGDASGVVVTTGWSITTVDVTFTGNSNTGNGGALTVGGGGSAVVVRSSFDGNDSGADGAAIWANASVTVRESTFSFNGSEDTDLGGAVATPGGISVDRSTFTGNVAVDGAAMHADTVWLSAATIAGDDPGPAGAAVVATDDLESETSIIRPADGNACDVGDTGISGGYNLISNSSCFAPATGDATGQAALGSLQANGGHTETLLPVAAGSGQVSVIDAIPASATASCADLGHDQRQVDRPQGAGCEIGAVEVPNPFSDVGAGNQFFAEIAWMDDAEVTTGYVDGTFRPSGSVTRSAMAAFLYRLSGETFVAPETASFPDVTTTHPFFLEVEWLNDSGITGGYSDNTFRPAAPVTRQAMAAFVYRFEGEPGFIDPTTPSFSDVGTGNLFFTEIEWMADAGISSGYVDGTWRPGVNVSRQAMARFLFVASNVGEAS
jgi:hypothetical protein